MLRCARKAKYFNLILDSTPAVSNKKNFPLLLRYVDISNSDVKIKGHFVIYQAVEKSTGQILIRIMRILLEVLNLSSSV